MDGFSLFAGKLTTYLGILIACALGIPLPEEITLLSVGVLVAAKQLNLYHAIMVGVVGAFLSDAILFFMGRCFGIQLFRIPFIGRALKSVSSKRLESCISKNGALFCFCGRFFPGLRVAIFTTAGMLGIKPQIFLAIDILAAVIDIAFWIFVGTLMENFVDVIKYAEEIKMIIMLLALSFLLINIIRKYITYSPFKV